MTWFDNAIAQAVFWSLATIGFYILARKLHRRWQHGWLTPLLVTPVILIGLALMLHESYGAYIRGTGWLVTLLGPTMVAFAVPIYEQRKFIYRHWPVLAVGAVAGSVTAMVTGWCLATFLGLDGALRLSLLPRSISTPFAMEVSGDIGGIPDLTAVFVVVTGVLGAVLGEIMLARMPVSSTLARGAALGMGAHGAGTAKAHEIGTEEGSVAGLIMVLVGLLNVLIAPVIAYCLRG